MHGIACAAIEFEDQHKRHTTKHYNSVVTALLYIHHFALATVRISVYNYTQTYKQNTHCMSCGLYMQNYSLPDYDARSNGPIDLRNS